MKKAYKWFATFAGIAMAASLQAAAIPASGMAAQAAPEEGQAATEEEQTACDEGRRVTFGLEAATEGQWNMTGGQGAWANRLDASLGVRLWRGAQAEAAVMATYNAGREVADVWQDFSNLNAPNRPLRLIHCGLQQTFAAGRVRAFLGVRQADEDYFCSPQAGLFTGASYGCVPTVNDNFHINVFPMSALGLHVEYDPVDNLTLKTTLYNGNAYDTVDRIFRFRPHTDGVINLGSMTYTRPAGGDELPATYTAGWNVGNHNRKNAAGRHTQAGFWLVAEQPVCRLGRVQTVLGATFAKEFSDPEVAETYWNAALSIGNLTRRGGTLAVGVSRAYYREAHETDMEVTYSMPLGKYFSVQPALHCFSTNGERQVVGQLRVALSL